MDVKDFDYELPEELIAQDPLEDRSASRLMVLDRETGEIQHRIFKDITEYLRPGDCLPVLLPPVSWHLRNPMPEEPWSSLCRPPARKPGWLQR